MLLKDLGGPFHDADIQLQSYGAQTGQERLRTLSSSGKAAFSRATQLSKSASPRVETYGCRLSFSVLPLGDCNCSSKLPNAGVLASGLAVRGASSAVRRLERSRGMAKGITHFRAWKLYEMTEKERRTGSSLPGTGTFVGSAEAAGRAWKMENCCCGLSAGTVIRRDQSSHQPIDRDKYETLCTS